MNLNNDSDNDTELMNNKFNKQRYNDWDYDDDSDNDERDVIINGSNKKDNNYGICS